MIDLTGLAAAAVAGVVAFVLVARPIRLAVLALLVAVGASAAPLGD